MRRVALWRWRYIYARPMWRLDDTDRLVQLVETHGEDSRAVRNAVRDTGRWVPWWKRIERWKPNA